MLRTVEATLDTHGHVRLKENVSLNGPARVLVTFLDDPLAVVTANEPAILAEKALSPGWSGVEADEDWKHLSQLPDLDEAAT